MLTYKSWYVHVHVLLCLHTRIITAFLFELKAGIAFPHAFVMIFEHHIPIKQETQADRADPEYASGPVASSLDRVLSQFHVQRQAYHGKAFVGNHVHKCCTVHQLHSITSLNAPIPCL